MNIFCEKTMKQETKSQGQTIELPDSFSFRQNSILLSFVALIGVNMISFFCIPVSI